MSHRFVYLLAVLWTGAALAWRDEMAVCLPTLAAMHWVVVPVLFVIDSDKKPTPPHSEKAQ